MLLSIKGDKPLPNVPRLSLPPGSGASSSSGAAGPRLARSPPEGRSLPSSATIKEVIRACVERHASPRVSGVCQDDYRAGLLQLGEADYLGLWEAVTRWLRSKVLEEEGRSVGGAAVDVVGLGRVRWSAEKAGVRLPCFELSEAFAKSYHAVSASSSRVVEGRAAPVAHCSVLQGKELLALLSSSGAGGCGRWLLTEAAASQALASLRHVLGLAIRHRIRVEVGLGFGTLSSDGTGRVQVRFCYYSPPPGLLHDQVVLGSGRLDVAKVLSSSPRTRVGLLKKKQRAGHKAAPPRNKEDRRVSRKPPTSHGPAPEPPPPSSNQEPPSRSALGGEEAAQGFVHRGRRLLLHHHTRQALEVRPCSSSVQQLLLVLDPCSALPCGAVVAGGLLGSASARVGAYYSGPLLPLLADVATTSAAGALHVHSKPAWGSGLDQAPPAPAGTAEGDRSRRRRPTAGGSSAAAASEPPTLCSSGGLARYLACLQALERQQQGDAWLGRQVDGAGLGLLASERIGPRLGPGLCELWQQAGRGGQEQQQALARAFQHRMRRAVLDYLLLSAQERARLLLRLPQAPGQKAGLDEEEAASVVAWCEREEYGEAAGHGQAELHRLLLHQPHYARARRAAQGAYVEHARRVEGRLRLVKAAVGMAALERHVAGLSLVDLPASAADMCCSAGAGGGWEGPLSPSALEARVEASVEEGRARLLRDYYEPLAGLVSSTLAEWGAQTARTRRERSGEGDDDDDDERRLLRLANLLLASTLQGVLVRSLWQLHGFFHLFHRPPAATTPRRLRPHQADLKRSNPPPARPAIRLHAHWDASSGAVSLDVDGPQLSACLTRLLERVAHAFLPGPPPLAPPAAALLLMPRPPHPGHETSRIAFSLPRPATPPECMDPDAAPFVSVPAGELASLRSDLCRLAHQAVTRAQDGLAQALASTCAAAATATARAAALAGTALLEAQQEAVVVVVALSPRGAASLKQRAAAATQAQPDLPPRLPLDGPEDVAGLREELASLRATRSAVEEAVLPGRDYFRGWGLLCAVSARAVGDDMLRHIANELDHARLHATQVLLSRVRELGAAVSRVLKDHLRHRPRAAASTTSTTTSPGGPLSPPSAAAPCLSVAELVALEAYLHDHASSDQAAFLVRFEWVRVLLAFLLEQHWLSPQLGARGLGLRDSLTTLAKQLAWHRALASEQRVAREAEARAARQRLVSAVDELDEQLAIRWHGRVLSPPLDLDRHLHEAGQAVAEVEALSERGRALAVEAERLAAVMQQLKLGGGLPVSRLQDCEARVGLLRRVWVLQRSVYSAYLRWTRQPVAGLDPLQVEGEVWELEQELTTLSHDLDLRAGHRLDKPRAMAQHTLLVLLSSSADGGDTGGGVRRHLRLMRVLSSRHLRPPHWAELYACLRLPGPSPALLTLEHVLHRLALQQQEVEGPAFSYEEVVREVEAVGQGAETDASLADELQRVDLALDTMAVQTVVTAAQQEDQPHSSPRYQPTRDLLLQAMSPSRRLARAAVRLLQQQEDEEDGGASPLARTIDQPLPPPTEDSAGPEAAEAGGVLLRPGALLCLQEDVRSLQRSIDSLRCRLSPHSLRWGPLDEQSRATATRLAAYAGLLARLSVLDRVRTHVIDSLLSRAAGPLTLRRQRRHGGSVEQQQQQQPAMMGGVALAQQLDLEVAREQKVTILGLLATKPRLADLLHDDELRVRLTRLHQAVAAIQQWAVHSSSQAAAVLAPPSDDHLLLGPPPLTDPPSLLPLDKLQEGGGDDDDDDRDTAPAAAAVGPVS